MKKMIIAVMAALALSATTMAFAANTATSSKDECLLASKGCKDQVDSIQQKIKKINTELKKGKKTYSAEELKKLEQKLKEANEILDSLEKPGNR